MPLTPPTLPATVTVCNLDIVLRDLCVGAKVTVIQDPVNNPTIVGQLPSAQGSTEVISVKGLLAGHVIIARQELQKGNELLVGSSGSGIYVAPGPQVTPQPMPGILYRCARAIEVGGLDPGVVVAVVQGNIGIGMGTAHEGGSIEVDLSEPATSPLTIIAVHPSPCSGSAQSVTAPPSPTPSPLPPVSIGDAYDCDHGVLLSDLVPGATVGVWGYLVHTARDSLWFGFPPNSPLDAGDILKASQQFDKKCDDTIKPSPVSKRTVLPHQGLPLPIVWETCVGARWLYIVNLRPNASVKLMRRRTVNNTITTIEYEPINVSATYWFVDIASDPVHKDEEIWAETRLCEKYDFVRGPSVRAADTQPEFTFDFPFTLFQGAYVVRLRGLVPGAALRIDKVSSAEPCGNASPIGTLWQGVVKSVEQDFPVFGVVAGDTLRAAMEVCGLVQRVCTLAVRVPDPIPTPSVVAALACSKEVVVTDVIEGSYVEVQGLNQQWTGPIGFSFTGGRTLGIEVPGGLQGFTHVRAGVHIDGLTQWSQAVAVASNASTVGEWSELTINSTSKSEVLAVNVALLKDGRVLYWDYPDGLTDMSRRSRIWNPQTREVESAGQLPLTTYIDAKTMKPVVDPQTMKPYPPSPANIFCSNQVLMGDGRVFIVGGTTPGDHDGIPHQLGSNYTMIFDPNGQSAYWRFGPPMNGGGRWYPGLVHLDDDSVVVFGGHPYADIPEHTNPNRERVPSNLTAWGNPFKYFRDEDFGAVADYPFYYPRTFLLPDGRVLVIGDDAPGTYASPTTAPKVRRWWIDDGTFDNPAPNQVRTDLFPAPSRLSFNNPKVVNNFTGCNLRTAILLPLSWNDEFGARVLYISELQIDQTTRGPKMLDVGGIGGNNPPKNSPQWVEKPGAKGFEMKHPQRYHATAVLLPDGCVFVHGGVWDPSDVNHQPGNVLSTEEGMDDAFSIVQPEMYNPDLDQWIQLATTPIRRHYHSTALLLPDGRIWIGGSNPQGSAGGPRELRLEAFYPPQVCIKPRPAILSLSAQVWYYGTTLTVFVDDVWPIKKIVLVRHGCGTHGFTEQRCIEPHPTATNYLQNSITLEIPKKPDGPRIAPPGYYMVFAIAQPGQGGISAISKSLSVQLAL